jgi:hypothetical protein
MEGATVAQAREGELRGVGGTGRANLAHRAESTARWSSLVRSPRAGGVPVVSLVCSWPGGQNQTLRKPAGASR